jgi:N-methylhydantoinase A
MGSFPVIVPPAPGVLCAEGDLVADFREEFSRTFIRTVESVETAEVVEILEGLGKEATAWLEREGIEEKRRELTYNVDLRYYRQGYEIPVEVNLAELTGGSKDLFVQRFNELHEQYYGYRMEGTACEIVNLRAVGVGKVPEPPVREASAAEAADASAAVVEDHKIYREGKWVPAKIYDRGKLRTGNKVPGPAIITEFDSTTVVLPGYTAEIDRFANILINPETSREE